jgi:GNAT superfamily N-acetyltransferase
MTDTVYTIETGKNGGISAADKALLRRAYDDVYLKAFNIPEEQLSFRQLCSNVKNGATVTLIFMPGAAPVIKALAIGYHYHGDAVHGDVSLLGYLATDPQYQGQGLGKKMDALFRTTALEQAQKRGQKLGGIFLECNPVGTRGDVMDPAVRIAMYKKWGAIALPIFYKQPPLELGVGGLELRLLVESHPKTGRYPSIDDIKTYLTGIYTESRSNLERLLLEGVRKSQAKAVKLREEAEKSPAEAAILNKRAANMEKRAAKMKADARALPSVEKNPDYQRSMHDLAKFDDKTLEAFYKSERDRQQKPPEPPSQGPRL